MKRGKIVGSRQFGKKLNKEIKKCSEVYEQFIQKVKIKGRSEQTIQSYHYDNKYFIKFLGEDVFAISLLDAYDSCYILREYGLIREEYKKNLIEDLSKEVFEPINKIAEGYHGMIR